MNNSVYEQIKAGGTLPSPNGVALELMRLVDDKATTIEQITRTVQTDPAIAGQLLKLVNSPMSGATRTIASVSMAVRLLGMQTVRNLALGLSLISTNMNSASKTFDFERFWSESLARAVVARNLVDCFNCCASDEAFTVALLSKIGRLALATTFPMRYEAVLEQDGGLLTGDLAEREHEAFGIDHNQLTAEMMSDWGLADVFVDLARRQNNADALDTDDDSRIAQFTRLLHLSTGAASLLAEPGVYREDMANLLAIASDFGVSRDEFINRFDSATEEWRNVAGIFSVQSHEPPSLRTTHTRASRDHRTVLIVDDDTSVLRLLSKYLADAGYEVLTAQDGQEALRLILSEGCQLVITDWMMPRMDGLELCRAVREAEGTGFVYIIVLTGNNDSEALAEAFEASANDYLTKPCQKLELLARLKAGADALAAEADLAKQQREIHRINAELVVYNQQLHEMATTDELTGLYNRREAIRRLEQFWVAGDRNGYPFACIMLDIDHFKQCNDTHGHEFGDTVLKETARILERSTRGGEKVFRIGGEEFMLLCPGSTTDTASTAAERLRSAVEANQIRRGDVVMGVTVSVGVAERTGDSTKPDDVLRFADEALYEAKRTGRNRVCSHGDRASSVPQGKTPTRVDELTVAKGELAQKQNERGVVLVADGDPDARRLFRSLLERDGFEVHEAYNGVETLSKMSKVTPDVVLIDIDMPDMDGFVCMRHIKADSSLKDIPVIMVGGQAGKQQVRAGLEAGARDYIATPIDQDIFLLRVRSMAELHSSKTELIQSNAVRGEQARAMGILFDLSRLLATSESRNTIVEHTAFATAELMSCHRVSVMLPDASGRNLVIAGAVGIDNQLAEKIVVPIGSAIAGQVFESGISIVLNSHSDSLDPTGRYDSDFFASIPLASRALAVPNKIVGVINVTERCDRRSFGPHEIEYLDLVCNMTASSLEQFHAGQAQEHAHAAIVIGLAKLAEHRDTDTGLHVERVTQYGLLLATELRKCPRHAATIDDQFILSLEQAMPLHDIGKVSVRDAILLKSGPLSEAEFTEMKRHAQVGAEAIESVIEQAPEAGFLAMARDIAYAHHEWFDGSGYPRGLEADEIPLAARIAAVADVYDALTTKRPYKEAFSHEKAVAIILEKIGTQFDPDVTDAFLLHEQSFVSLAEEMSDEHEELNGTVVESESVACSTGSGL